MKTFFIADTHFDDDNVRRFESRPFASVKEMNEAIISNWNKTVGDDDIVYLLGDIGNEDYIKELSGIKYLVKGNHDTQSDEHYIEAGFAKVYDLPVIFNEFCILSHEPMYVSENMPYANLYGHVHANPNYKDFGSHGFCVSVERIGYTPVGFDKIREAVARS